MLERALVWLLGAKISSSLVGIAGGAFSGAVAMAASGNLEPRDLAIGAAGGVVSGVLGGRGRISGEPTAQPQASRQAEQARHRR